VKVSGEQLCAFRFLLLGKACPVVASLKQKWLYAQMIGPTGQSRLFLGMCKPADLVLSLIPALSKDQRPIGVLDK
jgi:hypothetical protein